jgi:hypothetical protein
MTTQQIDRAANAALITSTAIEIARDRAREHGKPEPTPEEILTGLDPIVQWFESGPATDIRADKSLDLVEILVEHYDEFNL